MGDLSDKLRDGLAQFEELDKQLDAALKELGLPGMSDPDLVANDATGLPHVMQLCTLEPVSERHTALRAAFAQGADPNTPCPWGATAIDTLYTDGDADGIALLLENGADAGVYRWSETHLAVIRDDAQAIDPAHLKACDRVGDTPFLLACRFARPEMATLLFDSNALEEAARVTARSGSCQIMNWLLSKGADVNAASPDGATPLFLAIEAGHVDLVELLLNSGASLEATMDASFVAPVAVERSARLQQVVDNMLSAVADLVPLQGVLQRNTIYDAAYDPAIIRLLVKYGADPARFAGEAFNAAIGVDRNPPIAISRDEFAAQYPVRRGRTNPQQVDMPFWHEQVRSGRTGVQAKTEIVGQDVAVAGPVWSFQRVGRTATLLPDGRMVLVGGEHGDRREPDHCIYGDVTVVGPDGQIDQYIYPGAAFPPTCFHSATLSDEGLWLIGGCGLGYDKQTQVLWLSLLDFSIHKVATTGQSPGLISGHKAQLIGDAILVSGGTLGPAAKASKGRFVLDLSSRVWHMVN